MIPYIEKYKEKILNELYKTCKDAFSVVSILMKEAPDDEAKIFYWKFKADCFRYSFVYKKYKVN